MQTRRLNSLASSFLDPKISEYSAGAGPLTTLTYRAVRASSQASSALLPRFSHKRQRHDIRDRDLEVHKV